ncbi:MAG: L,D-transpeptidase family protein [Actinomycetota bacterium]|nr:L,D-transpeptidase family protein [Actinomycetota bacterium]
MRRALALGALVLGTAIAQPALAAPTLTLQADQAVARYEGTVVFSGSLSEAPEGTVVRIYRGPASVPTEIANTTAAADGTYGASAVVRTAASYFAVAFIGETQVPSGEIAVRMIPALTAQVVGRRSIGRRVYLTGRLLPVEAGALRLRVLGVTRRVSVGPYGGFRARIPTSRPGPLSFSLYFIPRAGYEAITRRFRIRLRAPQLGLGSTGPAVGVLERGLARLQYALRRVNYSYRWDTYEAVLAFQKVHGLSRTGRVGSAFWSRFRYASVPRARIPRGDHLEVSKTKQVLYEVRRGKVVNVIHVSTGATGNTPVGSWHFYRFGPGGSLSHMYYSMYFLRGFAVHGYHSVPPWPASHGCVRIPLWQAPGLYSRWASTKTVIHIFG